MTKRLIALPLACMVLAAQAFPQTAAPAISGTDAIASRQASMDMSSATLRLMAAAISAGGDAKTEGYPAYSLAKWAKVVPRMFPPGTGKDEMPADTNALAAIWKDRVGFEGVAADYAAATAQLSALAKANDTSGFKKQLVVVDQACRSCHTRFKGGMQTPPLEIASR